MSTSTPKTTEERRAPGGAGPRLFATTHWSVVLAAGDADPARAAAALESLCQAYWHPLYSYLRHHGRAPADAEDLIQGLFAQLLEHESLRRADPDRGHFRTFLLGCLKKYLADQYDHAHRQKRGGGRTPLSLDVPGAERWYATSLAAAESPDQLFERHWAANTVHLVLDQLREEASARGRLDWFVALQEALTGEPDASGYAAIAAGLGLREGAVKMAVLRLRRRFRELFRERIARTVHRPEDVDAEIQHMFRVLGGTP